MSVDTASDLVAVRPRTAPVRRARSAAPLRVVPSPRPRVALLFGGCDDAYDVSCASAAAALQVLDPARYDVVPIQLCRSGHWVVGDARAAAGRGPQELAALLTPSGEDTVAAGFRSATEALRGVDVALPAMHDRFGADATLQNVLERLGVAYVGRGAHAGGAAGRKLAAWRMLTAAGVPVVPSAVVRDGADHLAPAEQLRIGLPARIAPARGGQRGITQITRWNYLPSALALARQIDPVAVVERIVPGRRLELGVLERPDGELELGTPVELLGTAWATCEVPARLEPDVRRALNRLAVRAFRALGCQGLLQLEVVLPASGEPLITAVDTLPPLTPAAPFLQLWQPNGRDYADVLDLLLRTALARGGRRRTARPVRAR